MEGQGKDREEGDKERGKGEEGTAIKRRWCVCVRVCVCTEDVWHLDMITGNRSGIKNNPGKSSQVSISYYTPSHTRTNKHTQLSLTLLALYNFYTQSHVPKIQHNNAVRTSNHNLAVGKMVYAKTLNFANTKGWYDQSVTYDHWEEFTFTAQQWWEQRLFPAN